jgi:hypothetical protein
MELGRGYKTDVDARSILLAGSAGKSTHEEVFAFPESAFRANAITAFPAGEAVEQHRTILGNVV